MAYIGVSPSNGVRRKHTYTATANQTSFSGAGAEGATLSYNDSNFVDVYQNGVKLSEADYTSTSGTAIVLAQGASVSDIVEIVVYDVFSVADTVSKSAGGTFDGNITAAGTLGVTGAFTSLGIDDNADATAITITSAENVGIGTASPTALSNYTSVVANNSTGSMFELMVGGTRTANMQTSASAMNIQTRTSIPMIFDTNSTEAMKIDANGIITKSLQPAFSVKVASTQTNIALNGYVTVVFGTEIYDVGGNFASNTFTAPVTGKYQLNAHFYMLALDTAAAFYEFSIKTSNRNYSFDMDPNFSADLTYFPVSISALADLDANDTAYLRVYQSAGTQQTDISANTRFSGFLAC